MKNLLFLLAFLIIGSFSTILAQPPDEPTEINANVYFDYPLPGTTLYVDMDGNCSIAYHIHTVSFAYIVDSYCARIKLSGNSWSQWQNQQAGGWVKSKAGTYFLQGAVHVQYDVNGRSDYWMYSDTYEIYLVDQNEPLSPSNYQIISSGGPLSHPTINWSLNTENDLDYYEIWRKVTEYTNTYTLIQTTTANSFIDLEYFNAPNAGDFHCYYKIRAKDINGNFSAFTSELSTRAESANKQLLKGEKDSEKLEFRLDENYPNPFNPTTTINYQINEKGFVNLKVYDIIGKEVAILVNETQNSGKYSVSFNASNLPSGVYIYSLRVNNFIKNNKMTLVK